VRANFRKLGTLQYHVTLLLAHGKSSAAKVGYGPGHLDAIREYMQTIEVVLSDYESTHRSICTAPYLRRLSSMHSRCVLRIRGTVSTATTNPRLLTRDYATQDPGLGLF